MNLKSPLQLTATSVAFMVIATSASAETIPFERIDSDGDGVLSTAEITVALGEGNASRFLAFADVDGSGTVLASELREAREGARETVRDNRLERREDRRETRQDTRENRQETREDRRDRRQDRQDRREDRRDALSE